MAGNHYSLGRTNERYFRRLLSRRSGIIEETEDHFPIWKWLFVGVSFGVVFFVFLLMIFKSLCCFVHS